MTLHLTDAETEALQSAAQAEGVSVEEFAHRALREATSRWAQDRDAFLAGFAQQNKSLLDRLGQ